MEKHENKNWNDLIDELNNKKWTRFDTFKFILRYDLLSKSRKPYLHLKLKLYKIYQKYLFAKLKRHQISNSISKDIDNLMILCNKMRDLKVILNEKIL